MSLIDILANIQQKLTLYVYPLWLLFGIVGCLLNLIVFSRRHLRKTSCSICKCYSNSSWYFGKPFLLADFFAASFDHLFTLIIGIGPSLYSLNHSNPQIQSLLFCKIRGYLFQISLMLSRWFVAFACLDRYALTSEKVHLRNFASRKIALRLMAIIVVVWLIICSHRLIFYEIHGNICGIVTNMGAALYHSAYVIVGGGILPTMTMIISACFIRRNLAHKQQRRMQISTIRPVERSFDHQVLKILLIQIICYVIFIIPQLGNLIFNTVSVTIPNRSTDHLSIEQFVTFIAELILYLFPVTSFYLYTLTSRTFRTELMKSFRSMHIPCFRNRILPTGDATTATVTVKRTVD